MADKKPDGPAQRGAAASVTDAVRVATEASLTPPTRASGRREAAALKSTAPRMTAAISPAAAPDPGSIAPAVTVDTPAAPKLAIAKPEPVAVTAPKPEAALPIDTVPDSVELVAAESIAQPVETASPTAAAESDAPGLVPEPAVPAVAGLSAEAAEPIVDTPPAAESKAETTEAVPELVAAPAAALPAELPTPAPEIASLAAILPERIPEQVAELPAVAAPVAVANVPTPTPLTIIRKMETIMTTAEDFVSFQQGNFEALVKSGQIWAAGLQDLGRHFAATAQAQMDETMGTVKAIVGVKSLREAVELQSTLARSSMEKAVTEGGKITDATMKLAEQTMAPITARLTLAAEKFGRTAA